MPAAQVWVSEPLHADCELEPLCASGSAGLTTTREHDVDCPDCLALLALVQDAR